LNFYGYDFYRINADDILDDNNFYLNLNEKYIHIKERKIDIDVINAVWLRKFGNFTRTSYYHKVKETLSSNDLYQLSQEFYTLLSSLLFLLKDKKWITAPWISHVNKLNILSQAQEVGLDIPLSFVCSNKKQIQTIKNKVGKLISKSIYEPYFIWQDNGVFSMYTKEITGLYAELEKFFPSLVQQKIEKEYELRIFYLEGRFYSMAIFSQSNSQTVLDFRRYDIIKPNRRTPYKLPTDLQEKLTELLTNIGLNSCSIDIIKSKNDGKYYFLELNPVGQFGMVSEPCNYEVFKDIATTLIKMDKNEV
jgi:ATP-GRASP peptide maturase of grasp-with-spasm system